MVGCALSGQAAGKPTAAPAGTNSAAAIKKAKAKASDQSTPLALTSQEPLSPRAPGDFAIAVLPDHPTPWKLKTHTRAAIPFLIYKPGMTPDSVTRYDEIAAREGSYGMFESRQLMPELLRDPTL